MPSLIKRSIQVKVTLTAEMHARLGRLAGQLGVAPAAISALAIGDFVRQREAQAGAIEVMGQKVVDQLGPMMERQLGEQLRLADAVIEHAPPPALKKARKR